MRRPFSALICLLSGFALLSLSLSLSLSLCQFNSMADRMPLDDESARWMGVESEWEILELILAAGFFSRAPLLRLSC